MRAYRRQAAACRAWLAEHTGEHPDAFADAVGAEAAVTRWRRHLLERKASPASVNQALAAVTLLYGHGPQFRIAVKRARVERPGEPDALTPAQQGAVERAADRRDAAIIAMLLYRTTGIGGECSTEVRRKSGKEICEVVSESADGVGTRYEVDVARETGGGSD